MILLKMPRCARFRLVGCAASGSSRLLPSTGLATPSVVSDQLQQTVKWELYSLENASVFLFNSKSPRRSDCRCSAACLISFGRLAGEPFKQEYGTTPKPLGSNFGRQSIAPHLLHGCTPMDLQRIGALQGCIVLVGLYKLVLSTSIKHACMSFLPAATCMPFSGLPNLLNPGLNAPNAWSFMHYIWNIGCSASGLVQLARSSWLV